MRNRLRRTAVLSILALVAAWLIRIMLIPAGSGSGTVLVRIPLGSSAGRIAGILAEERVVPSKLGFRLLVRIAGKSSALKPGAYNLSPSMSPIEILGKLSRGDVYARWITFPEGYTIAQMGDKLEEEGICKSDKFVALATGSGESFGAKFPHPSNLEGYLFPDTYLIPPGSEEREVINQMLEDYEKKVYEKYSKDITSSGMTLQQIMTLASLIEKEAKAKQDRPKISEVLRNRLKKGIKLECDATILYALGKHKTRVFYRDLEIDSPYNTYKHAGLPPGPIASPGLASIDAALHPAGGDYLYYVARKDGTHIFTTTLEEHNKAKASVRGKG